jgi:hypothetical protein
MRLHHRFLFAGSLVILSWLAAMAVHELGHVVAAWATGGRVQQVVVYPFGFSRTDLSINPRPLAVAWAGAVFGAALPLTVWIPMCGWHVRGRMLAQFFAGFALLMNGAYLGFGGFFSDGVGDASDLIAHGAARWPLAVFGLVSLVGGLALWHGLGPRFGMDRLKREKPLAAYALLLLTIAVMVAELVFSPR